MVERIPPQEFEEEVSILGSMLQNAEALDSGLSFLAVGDKIMTPNGWYPKSEV